VKHDGRNLETLVVYPESKDKRPVVLLIHEIFGLSDWAQELADQVAAAGYIAVAPDLLSGMAPNGGRTKDFPVGVTEAVSKLNPDQVTADLTAAADYGLKLPATNGNCTSQDLLGRRTELPLRNNPRRSFRSFCFLRSAARQRRDVAHQGTRLRLLRRERRSD
jgi:hypothetical protein